jgi:hypothetical protein
VWREVIRNNSNFSYGIPEIHTQNRQAWKRYVVADSKACNIYLYGAEVAEWLPQIVALNRKLKLTPQSFPITTQELREWMPKKEWDLILEVQILSAFQWMLPPSSRFVIRFSIQQYSRLART